MTILLASWSQVYRDLTGVRAYLNDPARWEPYAALDAPERRLAGRAWARAFCELREELGLAGDVEVDQFYGNVVLVVCSTPAHAMARHNSYTSACRVLDACIRYAEEAVSLRVAEHLEGRGAWLRVPG